MAVACSSGGDSAPAPSATRAAGDCPAAPVDVVVSVDQWGDIVSALGGSCAEVTTVLAGSAVDPHDFEPAPKDAAVFEGAGLVVVNGGHYDEWATKLAEGSAADAPLIDAVAVAGGSDHAGDHADSHSDDHADGHAHEGNPHVWYSPAAVTAVADAVTAELRILAPAAAGYFDEQRAAFARSLQPYDRLIASIKADAPNKTYAATESVFDDMAAAVGLTDRTPAGFRTAAANESDPSPADLDAFLRLLGDKGVDVLIYNVQTEGSVPQQIRAAAEQAGVPVVEVTETVAPGATSFEGWQVDQLTALAEALGVRT
ncbi:metal ABC transporter solute-binding protein, Zn/Mn family [Mycolicibacterium sp. F2034L]|uniref:metal ABC transporter solute-binding protein, Zn/Mn family n=1 Tax=Mycolicibacterium sp. F2034L TaxID=2926422 RepID=UPI001FF2D162|nr:zinc ABC transporter substrate-binding protein [Mycolicibacterium sp. F2034L]MCK0176862.1 zinc ABC transporter substrate-binding protein [Mycolicibacterium sp. F2034L]